MRTGYFNDKALYNCKIINLLILTEKCITEMIGRVRVIMDRTTVTLYP